ncbi:hypothetical protein GCM10010969_39760 [Saccharibacillus kuerlensis]|uniref:Uncharacterized protein n=1 Tax=Saccharibacillus kuerlensis TaxID=459527 RepID=A0ABQ2LBI8_9BACL|nr:hypothetical protein GCM10010969_39760 [Saccharibacillus kuerlensis]
MVGVEKPALDAGFFVLFRLGEYTVLGSRTAGLQYSDVLEVNKGSMLGWRKCFLCATINK